MENAHVTRCSLHFFIGQLAVSMNIFPEHIHAIRPICTKLLYCFILAFCLFLHLSALLSQACAKFRSTLQQARTLDGRAFLLDFDSEAPRNLPCPAFNLHIISSTDADLLREIKVLKLPQPSRWDSYHASNTSSLDAVD